MDCFAHAVRTDGQRWARLPAMSDHDVIPPSPQHRDEEILQHVLREVHAGRTLHEVMQDSYVVEREEAGSHEKVLDHPEVAEVVGDEIIAQMRAMLDSL